MANNVSEWFTSDSSNNTGSAPDFPVEGQSPSSVNDTMRTIYGAIARWYQDTNGTLVTSGTSNAYVLTTNNSHAALADQSFLVFQADRANTGAATLNVDGLGAKSLRINGDALASGDLVADKVYIAVYNDTDDAYDLIGGAIPDDSVTTAKINDDAVTTAKIADDAVTYAKVQNVSATDRVLGRSSAGAGVIEEITVTSAGRALIDDASASAQRTTLGLGTAATQADTRYNHRSNNLSDVANAGTARSNLGLGSLATASSVNNSNWSGTDLAVANGGTGASAAGGARTNLGIGSMATRDVTIQNGGSPSGGSDGDVVLIY